MLFNMKCLSQVNELNDFYYGYQVIVGYNKSKELTDFRIKSQNLIKNYISVILIYLHGATKRAYI